MVLRGHVAQAAIGPVPILDAGKGGKRYTGSVVISRYPPCAEPSALDAEHHTYGDPDILVDDKNLFYQICGISRHLGWKIVFGTTSEFHDRGDVRIVEG